MFLVETFQDLAIEMYHTMVDILFLSIDRAPLKKKDPASEFKAHSGSIACFSKELS